MMPYLRKYNYKKVRKEVREKNISEELETRCISTLEPIFILRPLPMLHLSTSQAGLAVVTAFAVMCRTDLKETLV
jgi:hypothetical protein